MAAPKRSFRPLSTRVLAWAVILILAGRLLWIAGRSHLPAILGGLAPVPAADSGGPGNTPMTPQAMETIQSISLADTGKMEESERRLTRQIKAEPSALAYNARGVARVNLGKFDAALKDFDEAIRLDTSTADALFNRAALRLRRKDAGGALDDYGTVIKLAPEAPGELSYALRERARIHSGAKRYEEAAKDLERALKAAPKDWGDRASAEADLAKAREASAGRTGTSP